MPFSERTYRQVNTSRNSTINGMEQYIRGGDSTRMSPTYYSPTSSSPSSPHSDKLKSIDPEEDHALYQKKSSVLSKVKEKARRFRNSLNKKKLEDENFTPSWGVSLEDDGEEEEDAEYLGAPMYESELAPEGYKENARQHPRANPVISEKHVLQTCIKSGVQQDRENSLGLVNSTTTTQPQTTTPTHAGPNCTMNATIAQKLTPIIVGGSDSSNSLSSKTHAVSTTPQGNTFCQTCSPAPSPVQYSSSPYASLSGGNTSSNGATVTYEETTPSIYTSNVGVIEKVKEAVNSLLWNEEPSQQYTVKTPTTLSSSQTQEVDQEENRGRILQAN
ncbi:uncharacterized protein LOC113855972 [Abrus precatorius]|uniref:Uncharacterized protein LOC113855972 n=1 Tax=Abrus precatorius TaxID=3816 RepID=A0A8B8KHV5_ABRPR|nr:uncharacterized protein LOC113855972 [Abrus precatorius]